MTSLFMFFIIAVAILCFIIWIWLLVTGHKTLEGKPFELQRSQFNPLISPQDYGGWEACGVFNPAAYKDDNGVVHILYRAIGSDGVSRLGYARSDDGLSISDKESFPVFAIENPRNFDKKIYHYDPVMYPSGGSWGGCEDPRLVKIDDRLYLTFNAFDGWDFIRIGLSSILEKDFLARKWDWKKPVLISPEEQIHKNWLLFPEKINGKFAILHSISPSVMVDYRDSLEAIGKREPHIKSPVGPRSAKRESSWDWLIRGAGCPPIKTDKGWLVLYHAIEKHEGDRYKIGALLLDLKDPNKVIARSPGPLLSPDCWYENDGKPGIVYACGAVVRDGVLLVYYGGGDRHTCVAQSPIDEVLSWLVKEKKNTK